MTKTINEQTEPVNVIIDKDRQRNLYIVQFDARQINPRVTVGSTWVAHDRRHDHRYLMRVVEISYSDGFDLQRILSLVHQNPDQLFDDRANDFYCAERAWLRIEGEFVQGSGIKDVYDQPTVFQTFLKPTKKADQILIAAPDSKRGFAIGFLRSGAQDSNLVVTLEDRFVGYRTLVSGASGFGKSTLVRNKVRHWLENNHYGKIIDDLKGEYIGDTKNERGELVPGLYHHPKAKKNLYLLTARPKRFEGVGLEDYIAEIIPLEFSINDIPPENLEDIATHITQPQKTFLDMYQDKPDLYQILLKESGDGSPDTKDWHQVFKGWIVLSKTGEAKAKDPKQTIEPGDIIPSSYTPIHGVIRQLRRLVNRPYVSSNNSSCLPQIKELLKSGATIILDKSGLTDGDKSIISTVIANNLYNHNYEFSSGNKTEQAKVIPFVYLVEEAHLLLSSDKAKEGSVFVNFAKTGRSFQIGLVAVTQRPSSVDTNILSQFDNYITFRLTNEQDVKDLIKAKSDFQGYEGDIRVMKRGAAITAFGEPTKVQTIQVFEWTEKRAGTLLSEEQTRLLEAMMLADKSEY